MDDVLRRLHQKKSLAKNIFDKFPYDEAIKGMGGYNRFIKTFTEGLEVISDGTDLYKYCFHADIKNREFIMECVWYEEGREPTGMEIGPYKFEGLMLIMDDDTTESRSHGFQYGFPEVIVFEKPWNRNPKFHTIQEIESFNLIDVPKIVQVKIPQKGGRYWIYTVAPYLFQRD